MCRLSDIDPVLEQAVEGTPVEGGTAKFASGRGRPAFGDDASALEIVTQQPHVSEIQIPAKDEIDGLGLGRIDDQLAAVDVVAERRLHMQTTFFENGNVHLPRQAPWLNDYIAEITGFPGTKYDDQVDSTTQALAYLREPDSLEIWRKVGENAYLFMNMTFRHR